MMREKSPNQERMIACVELNTEKTRKRLVSHQPLFLCLLVRKPDIYLLCSVDGDYTATKADYGLLQGAVHRMKGSLLRIYTNVTTLQISSAESLREQRIRVPQLIRRHTAAHLDLIRDNSKVHIDGDIYSSKVCLF